MYDLIIKNGAVIDGAKTPRYRADVGITGDRIAAIGDLSSAEAGRVIDASGKIVAPGFVDVHNHSDGWLLNTPHLTFKTLQGFTTEVIMADGISYAPVNEHTVHDWIFYLRCLNGLRQDEYTGWQSSADYMALLDGHTAQNVLTHIPYANLRAIAVGWGRQVPDDYQMRQITAMVRQGMDEGAVGLSTGMDYIAECFASADELVEACAAMSNRRGLYVTHLRYKKGTPAALKEAVEICKRADVPLHVSHLKSYDAREAEEILHYIDTVAVNEVDFSFDVYPYLASSTMLNYLLPYEVWEDGPLGVLRKLNDRNIRDRFASSLTREALDILHIAWLPGADNRQHLGKTLGAYCDEIGKPPADALCDLLIEERLAVLLVFRWGDDALAYPFLQHERFMMGSDGIYFPDGHVHPRVYGSATRLIGRAVRDWKLFTLEEAVYKQSGCPAARFGMKNRGVLKEGYFADVVVFDAATVDDLATLDHPNQLATGIEHVLVNGAPIIAGGQVVEGALPGRYIKYNA